MNTLVIYTHPNPASFNQAIKETVVEVLKEQGHETRTRDLYALNFDPVLRPSDFVAFQSGQIPPDIAEEQEHIRWAETLVFVYPFWWTGQPAILKGYIDRVFAHGFAYSFGPEGPKGLLEGKKAIVLQTTGSPEGLLTADGRTDAHKLAMGAGTLEFCGIKVQAHDFFFAVPMVSAEQREAMLQQIRCLLRDMLPTQQ